MNHGETNYTGLHYLKPSCAVGVRISEGVAGSNRHSVADRSGAHQAWRVFGGDQSSYHAQATTNRRVMSERALRNRAAHVSPS